MPHGRLVRELIQGKLDMAILVVIPNELDLPSVNSLVTTIKPVFELPLNFYSASRHQLVIEGLDDFKSLEDFSRFRLGFHRMGFNKAHTSLEKRSNIVFFNKYKSMIKALLTDRVDLAALDPLGASYWGKKLPARLQLQYTLIAVPIHLALSKKALGTQALPVCNRFWQQLITLKQSGELESVFTSYQHPDLMSYTAPRHIDKGPSCQIIQGETY